MEHASDRHRDGGWTSEGKSGDFSPRTITRDRMTRIGFAYNQKPDAIAGFSSLQLDGPRPEEEPPSNRRDITSRNLQAPASELTDARGSTDAAIIDVADRYAEWDSQQTIDAVAKALSA
jgi:hypothetical protein